MVNTYKAIFNKILTEEIAAPQENNDTPEMSDSDVWNQNNPNIAGNEELSNKFNVEGLPVDVTEEYVSKIGTWKQNIDSVANELEEIYRFATENADKPGAGEIFSTIGSQVEGVITDLGTLNGHLRTLGNKIKLSMKREKDKEQR